MQVHHSSSRVRLPHDAFDRKVLGEVHELLGGSSYTSSGDRHFFSTDKAVYGLTIKRAANTDVHVHNLGEQTNAARLTALRAFQAKGGVALGQLVTEVPGLTAGNEWNGRRSQAGDRTEDFYVIPGHDDNSDPGQRFFSGAMHHTQQVADATTPAALLRASAASEGFHAAAQHDPTYGEVAPTHSLFVAKADDLLVAATRTSREYDALVFHSDDPGVAAAQALGAQNLDHLTEVWQGAMAQNTPLAAGRFVMNSLAP